MNFRKQGLAVTVLIGGMIVQSAALACSTDAWLGGVSGSVVADSPPTVARYSELCGLEVTDTGYVQSNLASDAHYRVRFYVFDGLGTSDSIDIFEAYSDDAATGPLFKVAFDGSQFTFDATDATGGSGFYAAGSGWNVVELDWDSGTNTFNYWVNADATTDPVSGSVDAGTGTVEAVRLGAPNGFAPQTGKLIFDAFESHRSTAVGQLLDCDAEGDVDIDINDVLAVVDEVFGVPAILATGQPDCDGSGDVNINDALAIVDIVF